MFGRDDKNQNSDLPTGGPDSQAVPAADPAIPASDADTPASGSHAAPDVVSSAPSAPTLSDPMVTPAAQPSLPSDSPTEAPVKMGISAKVDSGMNRVSLPSAYTQPAAQVGWAGSSDPGNMPTAVDPDLAQIKQQALQSLEPLVGHLDQAPDEKFKTVMMLIQTSDNSKMLQTAYEAANQITDEKTRAQALLDIVNEINYFTAQAQAKQ